MAFRRSFRRSRFARPARSRGFATNKKWVGYHDLFFPTASNVEPLNPNLYETLPIFVPLVSPEDYGAETESPDRTSSVNKQERARVLRSVGHFSLIGLNQRDESGSDLWFVETAWYFAVLSDEEVNNAQNLDAATTPGTGTDTYNPLPINGPALWRQPIKKFGMTARFQGQTLISGALGSYQETSERSWDFKPGARLQTPQAWYLVIAVNVFALNTAPPVDYPLGLLVMGRTLVAD